jgi:hypothetical protein
MQIDLGAYVRLSGDEPVATPFVGLLSGANHP